MSRSVLFPFVLFAACVPSLLFGNPAEADGGFKPISDGQSLAGWDGNPKFWRAENGVIIGETTAENPTKGNTFLIWRNGNLDDFELRLEYRIRGGNSGVQIRSVENEKDWGKWVVGGYQADIEDGDRYSGIIYDEKLRGIVADRGQKTKIAKGGKVEVAGSVGDSKEIGSHIKKQDWNEYHIVARGNRISQEINGHATAETVDEDQGTARQAGLLALQLHAGPPMKVEFRNIRLKRLPLGDRKKVVFLAGGPSHGYGQHEHNAGSLLLAKALNESGLPVLAGVYRNPPTAGRDGWPSDPTALDNADAIVMYCDGGDGHLANRHLEDVEALAKRGAGIACLHYGVEPASRQELRETWKRFRDWIGGYFEINYSVNPHWDADFQKFPQHPVARGVKPFRIRDEWYYNMRFQDQMKGITPILESVPPEETRNRGFGPHSGNQHVKDRKGMSEVVAWTYERPGGGRGFGFTGGHDHWNWGNDEFRKVVLNALVWISGGEVPPDGVPSKSLSRQDLEANQDESPPAKRQ